MQAPSALSPSLHRWGLGAGPCTGQVTAGCSLPATMGHSSQPPGPVIGEAGGAGLASAGAGAIPRAQKAQEWPGPHPAPLWAAPLPPPPRYPQQRCDSYYPPFNLRCLRQAQKEDTPAGHLCPPGPGWPLRGEGRTALFSEEPGMEPESRGRMRGAEAPPHRCSVERREEGPPASIQTGVWPLCRPSSASQGSAPKTSVHFPQSGHDAAGRVGARGLSGPHPLCAEDGRRTRPGASCSLFPGVWILTETSSHIATSLPGSQALLVAGQSAGQGIEGPRTLHASWERWGAAAPVAAQGTVVAAAAL